jgi:hypothetical protein
MPPPFARVVMMMPPPRLDDDDGDGDEALQSHDPHCPPTGEARMDVSGGRARPSVDELLREVARLRRKLGGWSSPKNANASNDECAINDDDDDDDDDVEAGVGTTGATKTFHVDDEDDLNEPPPAMERWDGGQAYCSHPGAFAVAGVDNGDGSDADDADADVDPRSSERMTGTTTTLSRSAPQRSNTVLLEADLVVDRNDLSSELLVEATPVRRRRQILVLLALLLLTATVVAVAVAVPMSLPDPPPAPTYELQPDVTGFYGR